MGHNYMLDREDLHCKRLCAGNLSVDIKSLSVFIDHKAVHLTRQEFSVLVYLLENKNCAVSREKLLSDIWDISDPLETRATDDTVKRIRKKLNEGSATMQIETIGGYGFIIREE